MRIFLAKLTTLLTLAVYMYSTIEHAYAQTVQEDALYLSFSDSTKMSSIEITPWGLLIGEYDGRLWNNPYNRS